MFHCVSRAINQSIHHYQGLMDRFAPQQRTNYVALLNEWAVGFYTELDFLNEAANQKRMRDLLEAEGVTGVYIPRVYDALCTRRVMVTEWVDGTKLSEVDSSIVKQQIKPAQEAFSTQLLQVGFFHSGITQRDVKALSKPPDAPSNIPFVKPSYRILGFLPGFSLVNILYKNELFGDI